MLSGYRVSCELPEEVHCFQLLPKDLLCVILAVMYHYDVLPRLVWLVCTTLLPEALLLNVITALVPLQSAHHRSLT